MCALCVHACTHFTKTLHWVLSIMAMKYYLHSANKKVRFRSLSSSAQFLFPGELTIIEIVYGDGGIDHFHANRGSREEEGRVLHRIVQKGTIFRGCCAFRVFTASVGLLLQERVSLLHFYDSIIILQKWHLITLCSKIVPVHCLDQYCYTNNFSVNWVGFFFKKINTLIAIFLGRTCRI